jgi:hypothetical protein
MYLQRRYQRLRVGARACKFWLPLLTALLLTPALDAKTGELSGVIFTVGKDRVQTVWPNARVTLKNVTAHHEVSSVSNDVGVYRFAGLPVGDYEVIIALAGFETITKRVTIHEGTASQLDFQPVLKKHTEILTVTAVDAVLKGKRFVSASLAADRLNRLPDPQTGARFHRDNVVTLIPTQNVGSARHLDRGM